MQRWGLNETGTDQDQAQASLPPKAPFEGSRKTECTLMQAAKSAPDAQQTKPEVSVRLAHGPERSVQNERGVQNYTHNTKPFWYGGKVRT